MIIRRDLLALGGAALALPAAAQPRDRFAEVTAYVEQGYRSLGLPGAGLLIARRGRVIYERYFGSYSAATAVPIASASKWLSAAVVMSLVDDRRLDLDAPASAYLPQFTGSKGRMTLRQMFSHTSGLVDFPGPWDYAITMADYAERVARDGVMRAEPGAELRYASASMQVVGAIAEKVTGTAWNDLFLERIAKPCGMHATTFVRTPVNRNPLLAGGAWSSMPDYGRFLKMIDAGGLYGGRRVLSVRAVREMQRDQSGAAPIKAASNDRMGRLSHYGLGSWLDAQAPDGRTIQVSSPGAFGFRPWLNLDRKVYGVFIMRREQGGPGNSPSFDPWTLIDKAHAAAGTRP